MREAPVYLDYQATTPVDSRVVEAMMPYLTTEFGNPSSAHCYGRRAAHAVATARAQVAELLGADQPEEIIFTSSGTESNALALLGTTQALTARGRHVVTTVVEHPATLATCERLVAAGLRVARVPVRRDGLVEPAAVTAAMSEDTVLVSVMHANNEIGTIQPIAEIADIAHRHGALLHTDAAQSAASLPVDVHALGVDLLTLVGHKMYAPKGVAALFVRAGAVSPVPQLVGGGQERGRRAATENVPGIVGLGEAAALVANGRDREAARLLELREWLRRRLIEAVPGLVVNGSLTHRLPGNLSLTFPGIDAESLMASVPELAFSAGAACHTGWNAPSAVLTAIGLTPEQARRTVRIGIGRGTTAGELGYAADRLAGAARGPGRER